MDHTSTVKPCSYCNHLHAPEVSCVQAAVAQGRAVPERPVKRTVHLASNMDLRTYLAGRALPAAQRFAQYMGGSPATVAKNAVSVADALIAELNK